MIFIYFSLTSFFGFVFNKKLGNFFRLAAAKQMISMCQHKFGLPERENEPMGFRSMIKMEDFNFRSRDYNQS